MYQTVANKLGHGLYMRQNNKFLWVNESFAEIFGYSKVDVQKLNYLDLIYPDDRNKLLQLVLKSYAREIEQYEIEIRGIKKDGTIIDISVTNKRIEYEGQSASIGSVIDISGRKKIELQLKKSQERYQNLVENAPVGIIVHQKGIIEYANPMALNLLGANVKSDIIGQSIYTIVHFNFKEIVTKRIESIENLGQSVPPMHQKFIRLDGREIDVEVSGIPILLNDFPAIEIMFWDVTVKKKEEELIKYRAYYDTLTDLPNRNKFQLDFAEEINKYQTFTVMYIDLEGLKEINDYYGSQAGDIVLIKIAARLSGTIGQKGLVYRMNGDEFSVVFPGQLSSKELDEISKTTHRILKQPIYTCNTTVNVSLNIGVVYYPNDGGEMDMLLRHANMAMNYAKKTNSFYKKYDF
ncbi:sensor domain-containing diguanylate cyclase [Bacillus sp. Marseille-P3661]|uniref:sensor domain-containing diguanylate cyclase n=1 Tax=Bacillus sp. Marseille-P3661 TaxID=1936234 RepID=UPI0015E17281|nr:sensor domain-containing diguanylate cyclase [Bacillus sp. Marseille-P3661]